MDSNQPLESTENSLSQISGNSAGTLGDEMKMKGKIPIWFNILLIAYLFLAVLLGQLFDPDSDREVPYDTFAAQHPALAVSVAIALAFALLLASAQILRLFWNRLISDLFNIRRLAYQEALSVVLMICFVSSLLFGLN